MKYIIYYSDTNLIVNSQFVNYSVGGVSSIILYIVLYSIGLISGCDGCCDFF